MAGHTALFFGSFNPIHVGHLIIASHIQDLHTVKETWLVLSPHNPLKKKKTLAPDYDRLEMVHLALNDHPALRPCDIEFRLPQPSYTVDTLAYMDEKYPEREFALVMGGDSLASLHKWKNYEQLLERQIYVYARPDYELGSLAEHPHVHILKAPLLQISASYIRRRLADQKSIAFMVSDAVADYIESKRLYQD